MNYNFLVKRVFHPITVLIVTAIFFSIPSFLLNSPNNTYVHDPLFWILSAYWTVALFRFPKRKSCDKNHSSGCNDR